MATQKEAKVLREKVMGAVSEMVVDGMEFVGFTTEGVLFRADEEFVVVRAIVKSESFDPEAAMAELQDKLEKAAKREAEKAAKVAKAKAE